MIDIILASQSAIRKKMLEEAGINFEVIVSSANEDPCPSLSFEDQLKDIAMRKAHTVFESTNDRDKRIIVAADQNIFFDGQLYGKPKTINDARTLIKQMLGRNDIFSYVGNALIYANGNNIIKQVNNCDISQMYMDNISDEKLENYLMNCNPLSKCGGINIIDTDFLHLSHGNMSTASGITIELLKELLSSIQNLILG